MPALSIGMPVYNGALYLKEAVDSILGQSFADFELIISDNASTDGTEEICRRYASKDPRVRYYRSEKNLGASPNFNKTFALSTGKYFKWASYDDVCSGDFFLRCIESLENDPGAVLSYPRTKRIDEHGNITATYDMVFETDSPDPVERFRELILKNHACFQVFGVFRKEALEKTGLIGNYSGSDRVLLAEVSLRGRFVEIPEYLFLRRSHSKESRMLYPERIKRNAWFDPSKEGKLSLPEWKLVKEYLAPVWRSGLPISKKFVCYAEVCKYFLRNWRGLASDIKYGGLHAARKLVRLWT